MSNPMMRVENCLMRTVGQKDAGVSGSSIAMHWISGHRIAMKALLAGAIFAATLIELLTDPPRDALAWCFVVVESALIIAFPMSSRLCSLGLAACFALYYMVPTNGGGSEYWGVWLAAAYLGYAMRAWIVALVVLVDGAVYLARIHLLGLPLSGYVMCALVLAMIAVMGRCMRWRDDAVKAREERAAIRAQERRLQERLEALHKDEEAALEIHDSVTGNLAYLAMVLEVKANQARSDGSVQQDDTERLYLTLSAKVNETLSQVRQVVDFLRNQGTASDALVWGVADTPRVDFSRLLQQEIRCSDAALAQLGFVGQSAVDVPRSMSLTSAAQKEVLSFLREVYTNIGVHGSVSKNHAVAFQGEGDCGKPAGRYMVKISVDDGKFIIDSSNDADGSERFSSKPHSGMGLELHARAAARLGGSVRYGSNASGWHIRMELPLVSESSLTSE